MTVCIPAVGDTVQYFAGAADRRGGFVPNFGAVLYVGNAVPPDYGLTVLVFAVDGTPFVRQSVIHADTWTAAGSPDGTGYWRWPPSVHV